MIERGDWLVGSGGKGVGYERWGGVWDDLGFGRVFGWGEAVVIEVGICEVLILERGFW